MHIRDIHTEEECACGNAHGIYENSAVLAKENDPRLHSALMLSIFRS